MIRVYITKCGNTRAEQHEEAYNMLFDKTSELFGYETECKDISFTDKGKPYFKDIPIVFNISHCKGYAVCGICPSREGSIGVDCEAVRPFRESSMKRIFSNAEKDMIKKSDFPSMLCTRLWTLKESYVKYTGTGLAGHMRDLSFSFDGNRILSDSSLDFKSAVIDDSVVVTLCCGKGQPSEFIFLDAEGKEHLLDT